MDRKVSPLRRNEEVKELPSTWLWILAIASTLGVLLFATFALAQDTTYLACPPQATNGCDAKITAPASPDVDRVCARKLGTTVLGPCVAATPGQQVMLHFDHPEAGTGHVRYDIVALDTELPAQVSNAAQRLVIVVDLDAPGLVDLVIRALQGLGG